MKAIALLSRDKYFLAKELADPKASEKEFIEVYKKTGGAFIEGSVKEVLNTPKYIGIYPKQAKKAVKKKK